MSNIWDNTCSLRQLLGVVYIWSKSHLEWRILEAIFEKNIWAKFQHFYLWQHLSGVCCWVLSKTGRDIWVNIWAKFQATLYASCWELSTTCPRYLRQSMKKYVSEHLCITVAGCCLQLAREPSRVEASGSGSHHCEAERQLLKLQPPNITWESNKQQQQQAKNNVKPKISWVTKRDQLNGL